MAEYSLDKGYLLYSTIVLKPRPADWQPRPAHRGASSRRDMDLYVTVDRDEVIKVVSQNPLSERERASVSLRRPCHAGPTAVMLRGL